MDDEFYLHHCKIGSLECIEDGENQGRLYITITSPEGKGIAWYAFFCPYCGFNPKIHDEKK